MKMLKIDHVTIAGPELHDLEDAFAKLGLRADYGGPHSNGITHMSLLAFDDGSYIELISMMQPHQRSPWWHTHIVGGAGPCGWAVEVPDVVAESQRMSELGIEVHGPKYMTRRCPDGRLVAWDLAFLGPGQPGTLLPFVIKDRTDRALRVRPSTSVAGGLLSGITVVVIAVKDLETSAQLFQRLYHWPDPMRLTDQAFGADLASFISTPVVLAMPMAGDDWLSSRLQRFGECPCAFLIRTIDMDAARHRFAVGQAIPWFDQRVAWFDAGSVFGARLGLSS